MASERPLHRAGGPERGRFHNTHKSTRRLSALPPLGARFAVHPLAARELRSGLREVTDLTPAALAAAFDAWLEGTVQSTVRDGIVTIPVRGVLTKSFSWWNYWTGSSSYDAIAHDLAVALADETVTGIVLAVESPGGQVDGCHELAQLILNARTVKPIVAHVDGFGASAAYWLASACDEMRIAPTAMVGSIGVCLTIVDYSKAEAEIGIETIEITSTQSPRKNPDPTTPEGRAQILTLVDALAEVFIADVATHRGVTREAVLAQFGAGDVMVGAAAVAAGLADQIQTYDAMHRALADAAAPQLITSISLASGAGARVPGGVIAALQAVADAAQLSATPGTVARTPDEVFMAHTTAASRPAAPASAAEDTPAPGDEDEKKEEQVADGEGEGEDTQDVEDEEAKALTRSAPAVVARIQARAAAAERKRLSGIRALARPGQEAVMQACCDDAGCTVEAAALRLLQHERGAQAAHLQRVEGDAKAFAPPPNSAQPTPTGDDAVIGSIVGTFNAHHPNRRPAAAGRS